MNPWKASLVGLGVMMVLTVTPSAVRADEWARHREVCDPMFANAQTTAVPVLTQCLSKWYQTRDFARAKDPEKQRVGEAAKRVYAEGDKQQQYIAGSVLTRLGIAPPAPAPAVAEPRPAAPAAAAAPKRAKYTPAEASDRDVKRAKKLRDAGFKLFKKGQYAKALAQFEKAIQANPGYVQALYDAACSHALLGNTDEAVEYLRKLGDIGTRPALQKVFRARVDNDMAALRDDAGFRAATGYVRVKLVNGAGEYGEDEMERIRAEIGRLNHHLATVMPDKAPRTQPIIWYKPDLQEARTAAYLFQKVLGHPDTKFNPIDWETEYDIIISWGDVIQKDERGDPIVRSYAPASPADAERKTDELLREQDRALQEPDRMARKVDHTIATPERVQDRAEQSVERVEDTLERVQRTGKKVGDILR